MVIFYNINQQTNSIIFHTIIYTPRPSGSVVDQWQLQAAHVIETKTKRKRKKKYFIFPFRKGHFSHLCSFMADQLTDKLGGRQLSAGEPGRQ